MTLSPTKIAAAAAVAVVLTMAVAGTARADDRDWRRHETAARHWHHAHPHPVYTDVYAPPVIVTPPPVYEAPVYAAPAEPGLNFIIPLHFH